MFTLQEIPLARWMVFLIIGITLPFYQLVPIEILGHLTYVIPFILALSFIASELRQKYLATLLLVITTIALGSYLSTSKTPYIHSPIQNFDNGVYWMKVKIKSKPKIKSKINCIAALQAIGTKYENLIWLDQNINLRFDVDSLTRSIQIGDELLVRAWMDTIKGPTNPNAFDYRNFMQKKGIVYAGSISKNEWKLMSKGHVGYRLLHKIDALRNHLHGILKSYLPNEKNRMIAAAMLLGFKKEISNELYEAYSNTGAVHILAVSGLHVGIVAHLLSLLFSLFRFTGKLWIAFRICATISGIWFFALLSGYEPAVLRASIMFSIFTVALYSKKSPNFYNVIALTALILLLIMPHYIFQLGFQLSFLAVISIVFFTRYCPGLKIYKSKNWFIKAWQLIKVTIAAQILVFPLIVYYFHKVPLVFIPSSLIAVPAAYLIILMGIVLFLTHMISTFVSAITAFLLSSVLQFLNLGIAYLNELPFASFHEIGISSLVLSLYFIFIIFVMRFIYTMRIKWLIPALGVCLFLIVSLYQDSYIKSNSKTLVSYDLYGASLVDFFEDRNNFFVQSKETNSSYIEYASQGNRIAGGVKNNINISDCDFYSTPGFRKNKTLYQLDDNIISMPNQTDFIVDDRISVYILNHGFAKNRAYQKLSEIHPTSKVVFDKSVRPWNKEKYLLLINESQVHDIYKEGAFVLSF